MCLSSQGTKGVFNVKVGLLYQGNMVSLYCQLCCRGKGGVRRLGVSIVLLGVGQAPYLFTEKIRHRGAKCFHSETTGLHLSNALKTFTRLCHLLPF